MTVRSLTAPEVKARIGAEDAPLLLDVREPWERDRCALSGSVWIPMAEIPSRLQEIPRDREVVVLCHHGVRSLQVAYFLQRQGYDRLVNLVGGIDAWAQLVDPAMPVY